MKLLMCISMLCVGIITTTAHADDWTVGTSISELKPGGLKKWCDGKGKIVYSNLSVDNFKPCGEVKTKALCNPEGRKFIGKQAPASFLDCAISPRISISGEFVEKRKEIMAQADYSSKIQPENENLGRFLQTEEPKQAYFNSLDSLLSNSITNQKKVASNLLNYHRQLSELESNLDK